MNKTDPKSYLYPLTAVCAWGSLYVVSKPVLDVIPPFTLVLIRYLLALAVLLPMADHLCRRDGIRIRRADWKRFLFVGIAGYGIATGAQFVGTQLSNASTASLINSMNPVTITIFAALLLGERITKEKAAALTAVVLGAFIILGDSLSSGAAAGILVSLLSVCLWSLMSVEVRRLSAEYPPLVITAAALVIAAVMLIPISAVELNTIGIGENGSWSLVPSVLYMGLVCTALSQVLWNLGLSRLEASQCGMFYPLQPMISLLLGVVILHETISTRFVLGGICIIGGILCNIWSDNQHRRVTGGN